MKHFNRFALLFVVSILFSFYGQLQTAESVCGLDWLPYKDEKCFRVLDDTLRTFDEAEKACAALDNEPTLPIVRSSEEQEFLSNYLFKTLKKLDNFWIGAKYSVNGSHFKWFDESDLTYTNWDVKGTKNKTDHCVQIQADETVAGKWIDEPCGRKNAVVCQKLQTWSMFRLQKEFLDERKQHRDALESANLNFKHQLDDANKKIVNLQQSSDQKVAELKQNLDSANQRINEQKQSLIPIGFLYTQLPNEKAPSEIWPSMKWADVSSTYAGVFFRVEGGGAATFGQVQNENAPHLTYIDNISDKDNTGLVSTSIGGWSNYIVSGSSTGSSEYVRLRFLISDGEVRPRNMAIPVWKRTG